MIREMHLPMPPAEQLSVWESVLHCRWMVGIQRNGVLPGYEDAFSLGGWHVRSSIEKIPS